jgi:hypothetical protein
VRARPRASGLLQRWIQQDGARHEHDRVHEGGSAGVQNNGFRLEPNLRRATLTACNDVS